MATPRLLPTALAPGRLGLLLALAGLAATELLHHVLPAPEPIPVILLVGTLVAVAFASLRGGLAPGVLAAVLVAAYTLHYLSPHAAVLEWTPATIRGGSIMLVLGLLMAIPMSLVKRREDRLRRALEARNRDLEERNRELTESNAALEAFGYVVSHDLKEPVRAVENYLEAALEDYGTPGGRAYVATARDANRRLGHMLQGLLAYSRASAAAADLRPLRVEDVLESHACRSQYEPLLREREGTLDVSPGLPRVLADEVMLAQLLGNLILNAARHGQRGRPRIRVLHAPAPPGRAHLVIADEGTGFPAEVLHRFGQLGATRPATVKGGFGLVISQRAAQRMGGRMWLANGTEGGAEAHVELAAPPAGDDGPPKVQVEARA